LFQYGGFLLVIFVLEISAGVSVYVYRDKLLDGFDKGLDQSIATYTTDHEKANDFDLMQSTVSMVHLKGTLRFLHVKGVLSSMCECFTTLGVCKTEVQQHLYNKKTRLNEGVPLSEIYHVS
jgi:tetraspanin-7